MGPPLPQKKSSGVWPANMWEQALQKKANANCIGESSDASPNDDASSKEGSASSQVDEEKKIHKMNTFRELTSRHLFLCGIQGNTRDAENLLFGGNPISEDVQLLCYPRGRYPSDRIEYERMRAWRDRQESGTAGYPRDTG